MYSSNSGADSAAKPGRGAARDHKQSRYPLKSIQTMPSFPSNRSSSEIDESPDLLRWRADLLLDEMMLGAVDLSAADSDTHIPAGNGVNGTGNHTGNHDTVPVDPIPFTPAAPEPPRWNHRGEAGQDEPSQAADLPSLGTLWRDSAQRDPEPRDPKRATEAAAGGTAANAHGDGQVANGQRSQYANGASSTPPERTSGAEGDFASTDFSTVWQPFDFASLLDTQVDAAVDATGEVGRFEDVPPQSADGYAPDQMSGAKMNGHPHRQTVGSGAASSQDGDTAQEASDADTLSPASHLLYDSALPQTGYDDLTLPTMESGATPDDNSDHESDLDDGVGINGRNGARPADDIADDGSGRRYQSAPTRSRTHVLLCRAARSRLLVGTLKSDGVG